MGRNQPRNRLGQFASYRSLMDDTVGSSKAEKQPILVESDSEDMDPPQKEKARQIQRSSKGKSTKPSYAGKKEAKCSTSPNFPRFFPADMYDASENKLEVNCETTEYEYSSDDVENMMNYLDKVFIKAEKKMCKSAGSDPAKTKEVITNVMGWLYEKVANVKLAPKRKRAKTETEKK